MHLSLDTSGNHVGEPVALISDVIPGLSRELDS